jgi:hypothetical protein
MNLLTVLLNFIRSHIAILILSGGFLFCSDVLAQDVSVDKDTVIIATDDTVRMKSYASRYNPQKSLLFAAVVPGLGQIYNKKYWKLPLVYGGFFLIGRQVKQFNDYYVDFRSQLFYNLQNGLSADNAINPYSHRPTSNIRRLVDRTRHDRDFWIIMVGAMYVLQIVDAHVDSHLKEFDLNPNLKVSFQPTLEQNNVLGRQTGMSVLIKF